MLCSAAMNSSMKVPDVVKIAITMNALIATDGPASHSQKEIPRKSLELQAGGCRVDAEGAQDDVQTPRGSANQLGPSMLTQERTLLTAPWR